MPITEDDEVKYQHSRTAVLEQKYIEERSKRETENEARRQVIEDRQAEKEYRRELSRMRHPTRTKIVDTIKGDPNAPTSPHIERAKAIKRNIDNMSHAWNTVQAPKPNINTNTFNPKPLGKVSPKFPSFKGTLKKNYMPIIKTNDIKLFRRQKYNNKQRNKRRHKRR